MSEDDIWAVLHAENIKRGGEWIETRLLSSGPRTFPWFQECGPRIVERWRNTGLRHRFDRRLWHVCRYFAHLVGRRWRAYTDKMKEYYKVAHDHIMTNMELVAPGVSFKELTFAGHQLSEEFVPGQYSCRFHGVGLCDEWPLIAYPKDWRSGSFDYELQPGMTLCVEALIGSAEAGFSIKLEDQILVTETGYENLTNFPFDQAFPALTIACRKLAHIVCKFADAAVKMP